MARAIHSVSLFVALSALVLVVGQAAGQKNPGESPDELRFNGNTGDNTRPSPVAPSQGGQLASDDEDDDGQQQDPFRPFDGNFLAPFGNGLFGNPRQDNARPAFSSLFDNLFGNINRHADQMSRHLERQFQTLGRLGEGNDVSYFNRNGVAYVRTCTTKKVSDNDQSQQQGPINLLPFDRSNSQREQQQQQQSPLQSEQPKSPLAQPLEQPAQPKSPLEQPLEQKQPPKEQQPAKPDTNLSS